MSSHAFSLPIGVNSREDDDLSFVDSLKKDSQGEWHDHEGEGKLSVDVAETTDELIICAPMAGTPPENIELHLRNDLLTIRGERPNPIPVESEFFHSECFWGKFSRSVVLPVDVKAEMACAEYKNGVLTIRLPKAGITGNIPIMIMDE